MRDGERERERGFRDGFVKWRESERDGHKRRESDCEVERERERLMRWGRERGSRGGERGPQGGGGEKEIERGGLASEMRER